MSSADRRTPHEKGQNSNTRYLDDWAFDSHMEGIPGDTASTPRQARHRCTQYPPIQTQPSIQPRDSVGKAAGREDRLRTFAKTWGLASCTTRFAEHRLAQCFISWLC